MTRVALIVAMAPLAAAAPAAAAPYSTLSGPERAKARFVVTYEGSGSYRTVFHGTPPNDGGDADTNDARDTSRQAWDIRFRHGIVFPDCTQPTLDGTSPCAGVAGLSGARGATVMKGTVDHRHVDGLDSDFDRTVRCGLRRATAPRAKVEAAVRVRYLPESDSFGVTAQSPVATAVSLFPSQCPQQGDSIDRVLDFYAMPGFSFADGYGPERWFSSAEVVVPNAVLHRSRRIRIPLAEAPEGTPPRKCAIASPSFERCRTGGSWTGVLTFEAAD